MTRYHGITSETSDKLILDSGAIYMDFVSFSSPGTLIGATRGGSSFNLKRTFFELDYEGINSSVVGQTHLKEIQATLETEILSIDKSNLAVSMPSMKLTESIEENYIEIFASLWDSQAVHKLNNIAIIAELSAGNTPIVIILDNPICKTDFNLSFKDKSESTIKIKFVANYDPNENFVREPWRILWPGFEGVRFVAVATSTASNAYSSDGVNWTGGGFTVSQVWRGIVYSADLGRFVAVGNTTTMNYSSDGVNWTAGSLPAALDFQSVTYGGGKFVAVAFFTDAYAYSDDGINWTAGTLPSTLFWRSVAYGDGKFVAVAESSNVVVYSSDGVTWNSSTLPNAVQWKSVVYNEKIGKFVAVSDNNIIMAYSSDGINWTGGNMPSSARWNCVASGIVSGAGRFVAIALSNNIVAYSDDGVNWTGASLDSWQAWTAVTYGKGLFVAISQSTTMNYSSDGINWTAGSLPSTKLYSAVDY